MKARVVPGQDNARQRRLRITKTSPERVGKLAPGVLAPIPACHKTDRPEQAIAQPTAMDASLLMRLGLPASVQLATVKSTVLEPIEWLAYS